MRFVWLLQVEIIGPVRQFEHLDALDVVFCHKHFDTVHEFFGGAGIQERVTLDDLKSHFP